MLSGVGIEYPVEAFDEPGPGTVTATPTLPDARRKAIRDKRGALLVAGEDMTNSPPRENGIVNGYVLSPWHAHNQVDPLGFQTIYENLRSGHDSE